MIRFGEFRAVDLGDLLAKQEFELMCPLNRVGTVDLYIASQRRLGGSLPGPPYFAGAEKPLAAPLVSFRRNRAQCAGDLHPNLDDPATMAAARRGAPHTGAAYSIKVSARADATFVVTNARNGFSKTYGAKE